MNQQLLKRLAIIGGVIFISITGYWLYTLTQFRIVSTDPDLNKFNTVAPYMSVNFNKKLSDVNFNISDDTVVSLIVDTEIQDKSLIVFLNEDALEIGASYTLTIDSIRSEDGDTIENKDLFITPTNSDFNRLTEAQKQYSLRIQDAPIYKPEYLSYPGFSALTERGMTSGQLRSLKQLFYNYSLGIEEEFYVMQLLPDTLEYAPFNSGDDIKKADFSIVLGGETYDAHIEYVTVYDAMNLVLRDQSGHTVFDTINPLEDPDHEE